MIAQWVSDHKGGAVLDLGGGSGSYAFRTIQILSATKAGRESMSDLSWNVVDMDGESLFAGGRKSKGEGLTGTVFFQNGNFMKHDFSTEAADKIILVGVLCGMTPELAVRCLKAAGRFLKPGGELLAATLTVQCFEEVPHVCQVLAKLGWFLRPKTIYEVKKVFEAAGYHDIAISSERRDGEGNIIPGQYAVVNATL
jgi:SAM-dependent methyltransferase